MQYFDKKSKVKVYAQWYKTLSHVVKYSTVLKFITITTNWALSGGGGGVNLPSGQWCVNSFTSVILCSSVIGDEAVANDNCITGTILRFSASK